MGLMDRYNRKSLEAAQSLVGDRAQALAYAAASAGPHPFAVIGGTVVVVLGILVLTGVILGAIPIMLAGQVINKPRGVVVTTTGGLIFKRSPITGKPAGQPTSSFQFGELAAAGNVSAGHVKVNVAGEGLWLREADLLRLTAPGAAPAV